MNAPVGSYRYLVSSRQKNPREGSADTHRRDGGNGEKQTDRQPGWNHKKGIDIPKMFFFEGMGFIDHNINSL